MGEGKVVDGRRRLLVLFGANPKAKLKALRQRTFSHTQHTTYHQFHINMLGFPGSDLSQSAFIAEKRQIIIMAQYDSNSLNDR